MPDRLKHTTLAGCRITPEVSTAVTSNRLCAMLAPDGAYGECDMLRASAQGKDVKVDFSTRRVTVDGIDAFIQGQSDLRGFFAGAFVEMSLP